MLDALLSWDGWTVTQLPAEQAAIFRLEGAPPSEEFPFIQESEALEILFCRKGGLILEWAGHRRLISLSADQVLFLPVRTEAYRGQFASESFYGTLVRMEAKAAWSALRAMHSDLGESISRAWNDPCMLKAALWSEALFSALDYMQPGHIGDYYVIKALEVLFLLHAQREGLALPPQCDYHTHSQIETIREIQKYLVGHLDERLTIQMLSQQFRISGTALKSCFRQVYGVPIHQYLLEQRMAQAAELLTTTTQSVLQISTAVGYSSVSQFGIAFKQRYHMSPSQFRRNANKNPFATVFVRNG